MSVSKKQVHTKRTRLHFFSHKWRTLPFVVRNEQCFWNLHGVVGNKECYSDKKFSAIAYLQSGILIFFVFVSSSDLTFFFRATLLKFQAT